MTGVADMRDLADERFSARCPECGGSGTDPHGGRHPGPCGRCEGDGSCDVGGHEVVTVACPRCDGSSFVDGGLSDAYVECPRCDGDGELTGPASEVCS